MAKRQPGQRRSRPVTPARIDAWKDALVVLRQRNPDLAASVNRINGKYQANGRGEGQHLLQFHIDHHSTADEREAHAEALEIKIAWAESL